MFVRKILSFILSKILFSRTITKQLDFSFNQFFCLKWPIFWKHIFALDCPSFRLFWYWCLQFRRRVDLKVMISRLLPARKGFPFRKINEDIVGFASLWPPWETGESLRLHYGICCSNLLFARSSTQMNGFFSEPANHGSPSAVCWPCGKNSNSICRWRDGFFFRFTMAMLRLSRRGSLIEFELPSFLWRLTLWFPRNLMTIQYCWKV